MFEEMWLELAPIKLWDETESVNAFSGMLRYVEKYMKNFFEGNSDLKAMITEGAGRLPELILPFMEFAHKLVGRELTKSEEEIIIRIFHREFIKLNGKKVSTNEKNLPVKVEDDQESAVKEGKKQKKSKSKEESKKEITININFYGSDNKTDWKTKLSNLFGEEFEKVLLTIKQNLPSSNDSLDIIEILGAIKIDLEAKLGISLTPNQSMGLHEIVI
jgi:hypothetical protein